MSELELATAEDCRLLYELMARVKALAPWEFLDEDDLFGVIDPDTGEPNFVSVMGAAGEHYAIALYRGVSGLYSFLLLYELGPNAAIENVLDMPHIQGSFEDRELVEKRDRDQMKELGLKFRGRAAWPIFRSHRPNYLPWFIDKAEARLLAHALEQLLELAPRLREATEDLLMSGGDQDFLVRVADHAADGLVWRDETMTFKPPQPQPMKIRIDADALQRVAELPIRSGAVEVDCFRTFSVVAPPGERPFLPYTLLMVDAKLGLPLNIDLITPDPVLEVLWNKVAASMLRMLRSGGYRPREFRVRDDLLFGVLSMIGEKTGIKIKRVSSLHKLDAVAAGLVEFLSQEGLSIH
jgi:hypothetical protein